MSTNYYARIIPTKERKKELYDAIEADDFRLIEKLTSEMYGGIKRDWDTDDITGGEVHLGKRSGGWKFLWNPNVFVVRNGHTEWEDIPGGGRIGRWVHEEDTALYLYPLTKKGIKKFIDREDVLLYDEYDELQDKEEFWEMALHWGEKDGHDHASYQLKHPDHYDFRCTGELIDLLRKEGFKFTDGSCSEFYSDGLRFASYTEFS